MTLNIKIQVQSANSPQPIDESGAKVCVIRKAYVSGNWPYENLQRTHKVDKNGSCTADPPSNKLDVGEWLLVVSKDKISPVVQRLTIKKDKNVFVVTPGWNNCNPLHKCQAATISINTLGRGSGATAPQYTQVKVQLFKRKEVVMLASLDHLHPLGPTNYYIHAKTRRKNLFELGKIDNGSIVTIFDARTNKKYTTVKSIQPPSNFRNSKCWIVVDSQDINPIGILDFYRYLNYIGDNAPSTVVEAGIYGHAYFNGPIIRNTDDNSISFTQRDIDDLDGRVKDWIINGPTIQQYPNLKTAFHTSGEFRIWGCNHIKNVIEECDIANQHARMNTSRNQTFKINLSDGAVESGTLDSIKRNIAQYILGKKIRHSLENGDATGVVSYTGAAAQLLGIPCFSSPVGAGSGEKQGLPNDEAELVVPPNGENIKLRDYYQREFGAAFNLDIDGYMNYTSMIGAQLPDPGWYTTRWIYYKDDVIGQNILRLPSGMELYRTSGCYEDPVPMTWSGIAGHLYVALLCKPDHMEFRRNSAVRVTYNVLFLRPATDEDCGVLVLNDGRSILMRRLMRRNGSRGAWNINNDHIQIQTMRIINFGGWTWQRDTTVSTSTISQGLLEQVTPQWYW